MNLDQVRKELPIYKIRSKLITEIQRNPTLILLGKHFIKLLTGILVHYKKYNLLKLKVRQDAVKQPKYPSTYTNFSLSWRAW